MFRKIIFAMVISALLSMSIPALGVVGLDKKASSMEYAPGEIIVKFKTPEADLLTEQLAQGKAVRELKLSASLDNISRKYQVTGIKPVVEDFKAGRERIEAILKKNKAALTIRERHLLRRLNRAPKGAKVPELDRIYRIELGPDQSELDAVAEYSKAAGVEYAELNYIVSVCSTEPNDPNYSIQWALRMYMKAELIHVGGSIPADTALGLSCYSAHRCAGNFP